ncbi:MAG TPA: zinc ABC transporter substrate-binding protein [Solirubrobacteraceae bacterium]|nr:zinc ABC transporter substrate-binding protein [Solirubrobacteraceae bacterium]
MLEAFTLPFVQRGLLEVFALALAAGLLGTWIVLRGLAFYAHAVGTAAFPGLVLAEGLGFSALLGAFATAILVAALVGALARRERGAEDALTALVLVGALALGVILASDVFASTGGVDRLLFGSLLLTGPDDLALAAAASGAALLGTVVLGARWLASGFDPEIARAQGLRSAVPDAVLLALVALAAVASLRIAGALLATALIVVPAATTRLVFDRMAPWQAATVALVLVEGVAGLWASVELNAPPGPAIAVLSGAVFAATGLWRVLGARRRRLAAAAVALGLLAAGCGSAAGGDGDRPKIVATTTQLADFARQVGGAGVDVVPLLRANSDPHEYEPRPRDIQDVAQADLVLRSGGEVDEWLSGVLENAGADAPVVDAGAGRPFARAEPHWWHDPRNARHAVARIRDALIRVEPSGRARFTRNAAAYDRRLRALDAGIARCMAAVPAAQRKMVTDHDAFGAFAARYGITVVGAVIPARTTQAQPSAGELSRLAGVIRRERVRAVFPEASVNARLARAIAEQTGASARYELYGDTLGPAGSDGATYLQSEAHNADAMVRGFTGGRRGCAAPR